MGKLFETNIAETLKDKIKLKNLLNTLTECFFLLVIFCLSYRIQVGLTTFYIDPNYTFWRRLYKLTLLAAGFKAVMNHKNKTLWLSIPVAAVFYLAFPYEHYIMQAFYAPLIIGCVGVKVRKIFWAAFIPATVVIIVMMMASLSGAINSMATFDRNIRSYWGHISPTDFGTAVLMIVCFIWILFKDLPEEFFLIPAAFSLFISFYVTRSSTSGYLTVLLILMFFCRAFGRRLVEKTGRFKWMQKLTDIVMVLAFPALGLITIAMVYAYYKEMPFAATIDTLTHGRLSPAANMLARHGLKPFGTYFDMVGWGGATVWSNQEYTFIDSSYPQILIRYGFITYIVANVMWIYTTWKVLKTGNRRVAYVMALLAMDFIMEHHWYELSYNVFIVIPFADYIAGIEEKESIIERAITDFKERWKNKRYAFTFTVMSLCQLLGIFLLMPTAFSWLRTIINGYGLYGGGKKVFAAFTLIFITAVTFIWNLSSIVAGVISEKKIRKINAVTFACAFVIGLASLMLGNVMINRVTYENKARIEEERDLLELIISEASGKVYADKLPEAYLRNIKGISRSYFCGEDFARYNNVTIIIDASWDSLCLTGRGFLYLQISEKDAIYTNDDRVIEVLKGNGYKLKGYNSYENKVDMVTLARMNNVEVLENGTIHLEGTEHQIEHGPYLTLYDGRFTAKLRMKLSNNNYRQVDKICTIKIFSSTGTEEKAAVDLYGRDFDEKGNCKSEVVFMGGGQNYEFNILSENGVKLDIYSISYCRNPESDIHRKIDSEGRVIRTEYYDFDGNPKEVMSGYYGCEYAYDDNNNIIIERYLGSNLEPVMTEEGYAEVHREYNKKKEVVKESYYGVDGKNVEIQGGYHSVEKMYNFLGILISESYFDNEGNPTLLNDAYFKYIRFFNEANRWIRTEYYDIDNKMILQKEGYAIIEREYDDVGNVIEERYYGLQGEPVLYNKRYHKVKKEYNNKNQCIKEKFYGTDGKLIIQNGNYAGFEIEYDEVGNIIMQTHFGIDEKPIITEKGYSSWRYTYNSKKQVVHEDYFGIDGEPVLIYGKYSMIDYVYNENDKLVKRIYRDIEGKVVEEQMVE